MTQIPAEAFGVRAWRVEEPMQLRGVLAKALAHDRPALVEVVSQPHEERAAVSEWIV